MSNPASELVSMQLESPPEGIAWSQYDLQVLDPSYPLDRLELLLLGAAIFGDAVRYWIGDLLLFTEGRYGELAAQISDSLGLSYDQIERYRRVCERVSGRRRRKWGEKSQEKDFRLFWTHVQMLARFETVVEQEEWFGRLLENGWTPSQLRDQLREARAIAKVPDPDPEPTRPPEILPPTATVDVARGLSEVRETLEKVASVVSPEGAEALGLPRAKQAIESASATVADAVRVLARPGLVEVARRVVKEATRSSGFAMVPVEVWEEFVAVVAAE